MTRQKGKQMTKSVPALRTSHNHGEMLLAELEDNTIEHQPTDTESFT